MEWVTSEVIPAIRKTGAYAYPARPNSSAYSEPMTGKWVTAKEMAPVWGCSSRTAKRQLDQMVINKQAMVRRPVNPKDPHLFQFITKEVIPMCENKNTFAVRDLERMASGKMLLTRFVVSFDEGGKLNMSAIADDAIITTLEKLPRMLADPDLHIEDKAVLADIARVATIRCCSGAYAACAMLAR
jgi:hypothetical protein